MKPWTPSTHHQVPQPAGKDCAAWYERDRPDHEGLLYALAHTKGERDALIAELRKVVDMESESGAWRDLTCEGAKAAQELLKRLS